jgi:transposase-like protein
LSKWIFICRHWHRSPSRQLVQQRSSAFSRGAFPDDIIALAVRWYVPYRLSYAEVSEWLAERGVLVDQLVTCHYSARQLASRARARIS